MSPSEGAQGPRPSTAAGRLLRASPFLLGVALLAYVLYGFGSVRVWHDLRAIGWGCAVIIALEVVVSGLNARAWWHTLPSGARRGSLGRLFLVQLAGSALNDTAPAGALYGEPAKVLLLKGRIAVALTAASLLSSRLAQALARALFVIVGMLAASYAIRFERLPVKALALGFALTAAGVGAFMALQIRGISAPLRRASTRLRVPGRWIERLERALGGVDEHLQELYRGRPWDFVAAVALSLAGLGLGVVQVWLLMQWIGLGGDWSASLTIEAFAVLVGFVGFAVPGSLGVQEGGKVLIFAALGLPLSAGLSVGVAFRVNNLANQLLGLVVLASLRPQGALRRAPGATATQQTLPGTDDPRVE
jgi:uncharacterized protein (TIRG00374 family)